ncbi:MAG: hypothetical protein QXP56_07015 [Archaeoglobaceae archaeon]
MEVKFIKRWIDKEDDSYYVIAIEPRVPREVFMACYKEGVVKKIFDEDLGVTLWDWDEQKATAILKKFGYTVISSKTAEEEERKREIKEKLQKKLEDPNTYVPSKTFETEYAGYSYSSIIKIIKIINEEEKEITLTEEGITVTGKAKIMTVEGLHKRVFDGQEFSKAGKFLIVQIGEKRFFAEIE